MNYRSRNSNSESRYSHYGLVKKRKEVRPLTEKDFQQTAIQKVLYNINIIKYFFILGPMR